MDSKHSMALVTGLLCILTVCSSRSAYGAPSSDPCSLLTPAQISAVLGLNVGAGKPLGTKSCDWTAPGQPIGINAKKVTVTLLDEQGFAYAKMPVNFKGITKTSVSGIGDDAVYGTAAGLGTLARMISLNEFLSQGPVSAFVGTTAIGTKYEDVPFVEDLGLGTSCVLVSPSIRCRASDCPRSAANLAEGFWIQHHNLIFR